MDIKPSYKVKKISKLLDGKIDFKKELNPQQYAAVTHEGGPALVIAGAGSGKTRTLVYRVAYLIQTGVPSDSILLLTFTNKAAEEMMRRVSQLINNDLSGLWGGTFHAIGARILKRFANKLGYSPNFTILDREDSERLLKSCIEELKLKSEFSKPTVVCELFSKSVNKRMSIETLLDNEFQHLRSYKSAILELNELYRTKKKEANVMDFDDLLELWLELMQKEPDILAYYQNKFTHILVDEYQDTNKLQSDIVELLSSSHRNLMVVGDDAQSIYSWRGANFQNIFEFPKRFPDAKIFKIEYNYRSTPEILDFANFVISRARNKFSKKLIPVKKSGTKPLVVIADTVYDQSRFIAEETEFLVSKGLKFSDIAVLYRSHFHALELQFELQKRNIPFNITSGLKFYEQAHIKDIAAFLRLLSNPYDQTSFARIVEMLKGVGKVGARHLFEQYLAALKVNESSRGENQETTPVATNETPAENKIIEHISSLKISEALKRCAPNTKTVNDWAKLINLFKEIEQQELHNQPGKLIKTIYDVFYEKYLKENYDNYGIRIEDINQFALFADGFKDIDELLVKLSLMTNVEAEKSRLGEPLEDAITLSTVHQAKGLEFEVVFIIMLCEKFFPIERSMSSTESEDEERRLFYVAVTRAKSLLYLCAPRSRKGFKTNSYQSSMLFPSPFLTEIPNGLCELLRIEYDE